MSLKKNGGPRLRYRKRPVSGGRMITRMLGIFLAGPSHRSNRTDQLPGFSDLASEFPDLILMEYIVSILLVKCSPQFA